jgi:hypothetical protein
VVVVYVKVIFVLREGEKSRHFPVWIPGALANIKGHILQQKLEFSFKEISLLDSTETICYHVFSYYVIFYDSSPNVR